ncbi:MAG: PorV/PorQ family protein [Fidelibacterota bacterium]
MKAVPLFLTMTVVASGQYERPGSTDAQFLKIGVSARSAGMGGAYIAVVSGADATFYNPAALARIRGTAIAFNHTEWFAGINHEFAAVARTFGRLGTLGVSVTALYTDMMEVRTPLQPDGTGETFFSGNLRVGISYSRFLTDRVTFGGTLNTITMSLYRGFMAQAYSADISILYTTLFRGFRFGMKIANFGSDVKFVNESYPLPTNFTFGLAVNAVELPDQRLLVSFSAVKPNDGQPLGQAGTEWNYHDFLFLRAGYPLNHDVATSSFGGGIQLRLGGNLMNVDYAYSGFNLLGAAHRFGVRMNW